MKRKNNEDIRKAIEGSRVKYYEVADKLGLTDSNFSKMLRHEISNSTKVRILRIITDIKKED